MIDTMEENFKAKMRWQCRRGMLELDLILLNFLDNHFDVLSNKQKSEFSELLNQPDPILYDWIIGTLSEDGLIESLSATTQVNDTQSFGEILKLNVTTAEPNHCVHLKELIELIRSTHGRH